eukprot:c6469_g1_i1.p1 GENE.c6469_g1_i1~~c6469_g1_i1.p1  ORF type:complete len:196 (+),score=43.96 c6469_g1_i1:46-633(+)
MTDLLFLVNTFHLTVEAEITAVRARNEQGLLGIALNRTVFHPQGGGQPSDKGVIETSVGAWTVGFVGKEEGVVWHWAAVPVDTDETKLVGHTVTCQVDKDERLFNARLHSAGHMIDVAIAREAADWKPTKGYHFRDGAYVEYEGNMPADKQAFVTRVQVHLDALINEGGKVTVLSVPPAEVTIPLLLIFHSIFKK